MLDLFGLMGWTLCFSLGGVFGFGIELGSGFLLFACVDLRGLIIWLIDFEVVGW